MKKIYFSLFTLLCSFVQMSCVNDLAMNDTASREGKFLLSLLAENVETEDITRNSEFSVDVNSFKVSLRDQNGVTLYSGKEYGQLTDADRTLPAGENYQIAVESCSSTDAETANEGWGQARFSAETTFDIVTDQTTPLTLNCVLENAGLMLVFDNSFTTKFPIYAATTQDARSLVFKAANAGSVAYYNADAETVSIPLQLTGSKGGWEDRINVKKDIAISKGKITRLTVKYDENSGNLDIEFGTDTDMGESSDDVTIQ